jgi:hypothetical protein
LLIKISRVIRNLRLDPDPDCIRKNIDINYLHLICLVVGLKAEELVLDLMGEDTRAGSCTSRDSSIHGSETIFTLSV